MSQMILFTYKKPNNLFFGIENNLYFKEYAKVLFHTNCTDGIYTIPNFDSLCVCAQKSIGNGISINQTELFKVLQWIQNEEIYMWYGAECDDLDCIENFETLINAISNGLLTSSGEPLIIGISVVAYSYTNGIISHPDALFTVNVDIIDGISVH